MRSNHDSAYWIHCAPCCADNAPVLSSQRETRDAPMAKQRAALACREKVERSLSEKSSGIRVVGGERLIGKQTPTGSPSRVRPPATCIGVSVAGHPDE